MLDSSSLISFFSYLCPLTTYNRTGPSKCPLIFHPTTSHCRFHFYVCVLCIEIMSAHCSNCLPSLLQNTLNCRPGIIYKFNMWTYSFPYRLPWLHSNLVSFVLFAYYLSIKRVIIRKITKNENEGRRDDELKCMGSIIPIDYKPIIFFFCCMRLGLNEQSTVFLLYGIYMLQCLKICCKGIFSWYSFYVYLLQKTYCSII